MQVTNEDDGLRFARDVFHKTWNVSHSLNTISKYVFRPTFLYLPTTDLLVHFCHFHINWNVTRMKKIQSFVSIWFIKMLIYFRNN